MAEENKQEEELKLREEQDGSVVVGEEPAHPEDEPEEHEHQEESSEDTHEEQASSDESEDERAARTERNRRRRQEQKEFRREKMESYKRELAARDRIINELNQRIAIVERRSSGSEMAQLERAEQEAINAYNHFRRLHSEAVEKANGPAATEAAERMALARQNAEKIQLIRKNASKQQSAPQPLDPRMATHAQDWMNKNSWYNPEGKDEDSEIALIIDRRLASEGWDPKTPEYWEELDKRVKKRLPHRANSGYNKPHVEKRNSTPPVAGSGRESSSSNKGTYKLSSERVQALKEAGLWDDPKQRADAIRRFQQYDKEQRA